MYYICVVLDLYARKVIAYKVSRHNSTQQTKAVVKMAYEKRQPTEKLLFHSDQGSNYTSNEFRKYLRSIHITQSFSNPEMPYDNSVMESFFGSFKREALYRYRFKTEKDFSKVLKHTLTSIITSVRILFSWTRHRINSKPTIPINIRKTPSRELNSNGSKTKGLVCSQKDFLIFPEKVSILKCVPEYDILSGNICLNTYKKTLNLNNYGSLFKVYSPNKKHGSVTVPFSYLGSSPKNFCIFGELGVLLFQVRQVVFLVGVLPIYYIL